MIYGYIRVSTETQTVENQKLAIKAYCKSHRLHNIKWISETISGTKSINKRKLGDLMKIVKEGDTIIITEISRLGRSLVMVMDALSELLHMKVMVKAIKEGFELGNNLQSKIMSTLFALCAEIERTLLSERTKLGLIRARAQGKQIGRLPGQKPSKYKLTGKERKIKMYLKSGRSKLSIAHEFGVTWMTLNTFINVHMAA